MHDHYLNWYCAILYRHTEKRKRKRERNLHKTNLYSPVAISLSPVAAAAAVMDATRFIYLSIKSSLFCRAFENVHGRNNTALYYRTCIHSRGPLMMGILYSRVYRIIIIIIIHEKILRAVTRGARGQNTGVNTSLS